MKRPYVIFISLILITSCLSLSVFAFMINNTPAPSSSIQKNQILVYNKYVLINQSNIAWFTVSSTKSMLPFIDSGNYALGLNITNESSLHIGDVITYKSYNGHYIIHRIIDINNDKDGVYYNLKGDNNWFTDPIRVRLNMTRFKIVAIVY